MKEYIILHNPDCSKSRETLELLKSRGISPKVIEYLQADLSLDFLRKVVSALNMHPKEVVRTKEEEFQKLDINIDNADEVLLAIQKHPKLLERPIVMTGDKAVIGRPPDNILTII